MRRYTLSDIIAPRKPIVFLGSTLRDLQEMPDRAREMMLAELERVQHGGDPLHWKPMPTVGAGAREIRIRIGRQFRVIYIAGFPEAIYVLHVFEKKTQRTALRDLQVAEARFRALIRKRREQR